MRTRDYHPRMGRMTDRPEASMMSPSQETAVTDLESSLGHVFSHREYLLTALRHRSYVHQHREAGDTEEIMPDNQRLEFLGDAVLSLSVSTLMYDRFPLVKEGVLSRRRAGLVNETQLADMARKIGVPEALFLGRGEEGSGGRNKNSILADTLEAILAAVYLDGGFKTALDVVTRLWGGLIDRSPQNDFLKDFKTRLQEETQAEYGQTPEYRLTGTEGPDHDRTFEITLYLDGQALSVGRGKSKKEAEQHAARTALGLRFDGRPPSPMEP